MKNITKNMFLLGSALTVCVHYTRGNDYNPDYREQVWSKIREAYSKEVDDFVERKKFKREKGYVPMCCECVNRMGEIVEECVKDYKKDNNVQTVHDDSRFLEKFKKVLGENSYRFRGRCCGFAELPDLSDKWSIPSQAIKPALEILDVCDRFKEQYECEMHAMHTRMMAPESYLKEVSLDVLRELISGYKRVSKKAAIWESCNYCSPSKDELKESRDELGESEDELKESEDELKESEDELEERGRVWKKWNKSVCGFLKSQQKNKSEDEIFDAFVGYHDAAPWHYWNGPSRFFSVFQRDWWAETELVDKDSSKVNQINKTRYFEKMPAWQYYHSSFTSCWPTEYCSDDFKQVAEEMVKRCTDSLGSLYNELSLERKDLDPTLIWFLDEVLKPRVDVEKAK